VSTGQACPTEQHASELRESAVASGERDGAVISFTCCAVAETCAALGTTMVGDQANLHAWLWGRMPPLDFFGPLILVQDTQRCPHLKGVGGGWLSAWVLWTELKSTRMPVVPGEHAQDVDEVVAVSRRVTWPPGRRRRRRRHVCVFGGSRSSSSRVSHCGSRGWWAGDGRRLAIAIP
jgi:hypothetical protein